MSFVFVATPYRAFPGSLDDAWEAAVQSLLPFKKAKIAAVSPIVLWHQVAIQGGLDPHDMAWAEMNRPLLLSSSAVVVVQLPGWTRSDGIDAEVKLAKENGIPIYYAPPGEMPAGLIGQFTVEAMPAEPDPPADAVDRPSHYRKEIEAIDVIEAFVEDPISAHHGNILKYAMRWRMKGGAEDLRKMAKYTDRLINYLNGERRW